MKYIVFIDYFDSFQFFNRLLCDKAVGDVIFITTLLSVKKEAGRQGYESFLLTKLAPRLDLFPIDTSRAREVVSGEVSLSGADSYVARLAGIVNLIDDGFSNYKLLCWNGSDLKGSFIRGMVGFRKDRFSSGFFEITNFPGYYFFDSMGVNAESSANIYPDDFLGDKLSAVNYKKYHELIQELIELKKVGAVPQVALSKKITFRHFYDAIFLMLFGVGNFRVKSIFHRFYNKLISGVSGVSGVSGGGDVLLDLEKLGAFAFMPLQVSSDSQLLINYHGGVLDSISEARDIALNRGVKLAVKLHPAEKDSKVLGEVIRYCEDNDITIVNAPIYELIGSSDFVVTVNSTVGFEAQIMQKEVVFIGDTQYSKLNGYDDVLSYVKNFFYEGDFFSNSLVVKPDI